MTMQPLNPVKSDILMLTAAVATCTRVIQAASQRTIVGRIEP